MFVQLQTEGGMKSLPGSRSLLGEIPLELAAGILGRSYDATSCT
jgi:hypothetical protein